MAFRKIGMNMPPKDAPKKKQRGMSRAESTGITARFQRTEIDIINKYCEDNKLIRSIFIHDLVMEKVSPAKR